ncbi:MAG: TetR/AcrR family transcriptional regulator [Enterobacteriaceae bacterium]|jgi:AcrR family transcriptional regulator|nr:TetR/AcrR family transcriptional regulator [Enterobacteriaceae bacterium]
MAENHHPRARGRPPIPEKEMRQRIYNVTFSLLIEQGYNIATMDVIAQKAKIAKKTLYRFVRNREDLIEKMILDWADIPSPSLPDNVNSSQQVIVLLEEYLAEITNKYLSPDAIGLFKLLQSKLPYRDILLDKYQQTGLEKDKVILASWLEYQYKEGLLKKFNFTLFSELAISMIISDLLRKGALGLTLTETDISPRITAIINLLKPELSKK